MSRLQELGHTAFLVGGSVRDLLLGRRPKDFDIGTSAQPHQIKRGFRNCWIIGRRFRLAHVKFGPKTIEVATFRRNVRADEADAAADESGRPARPARQRLRDPRGRRVPPRLHGQRALLRLLRPLDHRLRRRPAGPRSPRHPLDRRPGRALPGGPGPHAARRGARGAARLRHRPGGRRGHRGSRAAHPLQRPAPPDGGVLQDPPQRLRRGVVLGPGPRRPDRAHQPGDGRGPVRGVLRLAGPARRLAPAVHRRARRPHQHDPGRLAARAARPDGRRAPQVRRQRAVVSGAGPAAGAAQGRRALRPAPGAGAQAAGHRRGVAPPARAAVARACSARR